MRSQAEAKVKPSDLFQEVAPELIALEQEMQKILASDNLLLKDIAAHLLKGGGKRLRPALVFLAARFNSYNLEKLLPIAAAVELIHMATLVHDDVIDRSTTRRGLPTVHARWGERTSVLVGDYLFASSFATLARQADNRIVQVMAQVVAEVCTGEFDQMTDANRIDQTEEQYMSRIGKKTAIFIAESAYMGALASNAPEEQAEALRRYGYGIGLGFQIVDDILDFTAAPAVLGKPVGSDLRSGILTLPVIHALRECSARERLLEVLQRGNWGEVEVASVREILDRCGSFEYSYDVAVRYIWEAKEELRVFPDIPTKKVLLQLADFIVERDY